MYKPQYKKQSKNNCKDANQKFFSKLPGAHKG